MTLSEFEFLLTERGVEIVGANFEGRGSTRCCLGCRLPDGTRVTAFGPNLEEAAAYLLLRLSLAPLTTTKKPTAQA